MHEKEAGSEFQQLTMFGLEMPPPAEPKGAAKPKRESKSIRDGKIAEQLDVHALTISESQPRVYLDEEELEELCASIQKYGVLQPVLVQIDESGAHVLIAGQRRLLAARRAGLKKIPAVVVGGDPYEIALIENLQRSDLTCMEEAEAISRLKEKNSYTLDDIRAIIGKSKSTVSETLSLVRLPESVKEECLRTPDIAKSILVEIARKSTPEEMIVAYERYKKERMPRQELRDAKRPESAGKPRVGISYVKSFAQKIGTINLEHLKKKQREQMKSRLEELHAKIGDLITQLEG